MMPSGRAPVLQALGSSELHDSVTDFEPNRRWTLLSGSRLGDFCSAIRRVILSWSINYPGTLASKRNSRILSRNTCQSSSSASAFERPAASTNGRYRRCTVQAIRWNGHRSLASFKPTSGATELPASGHWWAADIGRERACAAAPESCPPSRRSRWPRSAYGDLNVEPDSANKRRSEATWPAQRPSGSTESPTLGPLDRTVASWAQGTLGSEASVDDHQATVDHVPKTGPPSFASVQERGDCEVRSADSSLRRDWTR